MIKEALKYLVDLVEAQTSVLKLYEDNESVHLLINEAGLVREKEFIKPTQWPGLTFGSMEGMISYLAAHTEEVYGALFVGEDRIVADMAHGPLGQNNPRIAVLPLFPSEEFTALGGLFSGVNQRQLWRRLISDLHGCLPPSLLLAISQMKVKASAEQQSHIEISGVGSEKNAASVAISYAGAKGTETVEIGLDWTYRGRVYDCMDQHYEIPLRLEVSVENGKEVLFRFHPRQLQRLMRQVRADIVAKLTGIDGFTVHEAEYAPPPREQSEPAPGL